MPSAPDRAVRRGERAEIEIGQDVAVEHEDPSPRIQDRLRVLDRSGGAKRFRINHVAQVQTKVRTVAEMPFERFNPVAA